ncbi:type II toxin-antitoxin system VapC family toxin [Treponema primitia]|uniref:type II toxin-antitoxin system VapC family toxin n=1 Tax=Treponema primitia TaxID=88058 RepID=UPI000255519E|nr:PIN domain-containing protein [Treponema primitia]
MKDMAILIDTNVVIDFLAKREPFFNNAAIIMQKCSDNELAGYIAAHTVPTVFYILRKQFSVSERRNRLSRLCGFIDVAGNDKQQVIKAIENERFDDLEDCLQMECAKAVDADYIVTRNTDDFKDSPIPAILPEDFLKQLAETAQP